MVEVGFAHSRIEKHNIKWTLRLLQAYGEALGILPNFQGKGAFKIIQLGLYSLLVVFGTFYFLLYQVLFKGGPNKNKDTNATSYNVGYVQIVCGLSALNIILFMRLSITWPSLMEKWSRIDEDLFNENLYGYPRYLKWTCPAIILLNGLVPFGQSTIVHFMLYSKLSSIPANNGTVQFAQIVQVSLPHISGLIANLWYPVALCVYLIVIAHVLLTSAFFESFVLVVILNLSSRLKQFTNFARAATTCVSKKPGDFWSNIRRDHSRLSDLVSCVDDQVCLITLCSYLRTFLYLLTMLTSFLGKSTTFQEKLYCSYTSVHYCTKLILVTLFSAWINEESTRIVRVLNSLPSEEYNREVRRLLLQVSFDDVVLTGCKMFKLKKCLILEVINAVVTYELIVIQYSYNSS